MKVRFNRFMNMLIGAVLSMLGFQSCGKILGGFMAMYGTPHSDFTYKAKVTDETGKPIEGIKTVIDVYYSWQDGAGFNYTNLDHTDTLYTNSEGVAERKATVFAQPSTVVVTLTDIDGEANGGEFEELVIDDLKTTQVKKGDKGWYGGAYELDFEAKMKKNK